MPLALVDAIAQSLSKSYGCDPFASVIPVNEKASDPPIRKAAETGEIRSLALDARKLVRRSELTPPHRHQAVVHKSGVSSTIRTRRYFSVRFCDAVRFPKPCWR
jgi:hypothetical protein